MYEIRDERGNVLDTRETFDAAEQRVEALCAEATKQAAASGEGTRGMTLRWTVVDADSGEVAAVMSMSPDDSGRPYRPISEASPEREGQA
ncbi:hypothetical protein [Nonomuraea aridisoli]|uniref:Uncharacterized protein n=1 Tax=Nonomuraea aridisoli TaxID=2070368 RepID=A0A2W2EDN8_9ACTN|nr:hypothetical protein [Nonomuraea aridisoli]PZG20623.1 hypothetical protein C1J01_08970 [Nonomuraea aridisoli]